LPTSSIDALGRGEAERYRMQPSGPKGGSRAVCRSSAPVVLTRRFRTQPRPNRLSRTSGLPAPPLDEIWRPGAVKFLAGIIKRAATALSTSTGTADRPWADEFHQRSRSVTALQPSGPKDGSRTARRRRSRAEALRTSSTVPAIRRPPQRPAGRI
jgi:hypothetical protein